MASKFTGDPPLSPPTHPPAPSHTHTNTTCLGPVRRLLNELAKHLDRLLALLAAVHQQHALLHEQLCPLLLPLL